MTSTPQSPRAHALAALLCCALPFGASAAEGALKVELNKLEAHENACVTYLVFGNQTSTDFTSLQLELVLFDDQGFILQRLALEAAPIAAGKTSVKLFEVPKTGCEQLGRILINDVGACADTAGTRTDCLQRIEPTSRITTQLFK
ncbi:Tat pathway signal sequence domain protein [Thiorhodococcus fuscus]|uniref:Tat pathway signal sequence domain protein n=1 Tax=Thiorhodococcus fuscus TaxID=527200 RepID=A0ABW4Y771_9GAMM